MGPRQKILNREVRTTMVKSKYVKIYLQIFVTVAIYKTCEFDSRSGEMYSIQHYVIKFVCELRQVSGFLRVLRFLPSIKQTAYVKIYLQIFVTVAIYKTSNICFKKDHGIFLHIKKFKLNLLALLYLQSFVQPSHGREQLH
jgi:flagellar biosynthesis protein FliR